LDVIEFEIMPALASMALGPGESASLSVAQEHLAPHRGGDVAGGVVRRLRSVGGGPRGFGLGRGRLGRTLLLGAGRLVLEVEREQFFEGGLERDSLGELTTQTDFGPLEVFIGVSADRERDTDTVFRRWDYGRD
jgi:hypothetical protein